MNNRYNCQWRVTTCESDLPGRFDVAIEWFSGDEWYGMFYSEDTEENRNWARYVVRPHNKHIGVPETDHE